MTDKDIIDRYFREVDAEAERYRDKQVDQPEPEYRAVVGVDYLPGDVVYLKLAPSPVPGMVTNVSLSPRGATYYVTWGDTRCSSAHYGIELTSEPAYS